MTDGADYPGYPEPEPEEKQDSKLRAVAIHLWNGFIHLFDTFLAAGKVVTAAMLGAVFGVEVSGALTGGPQIEGLMPFYVIFLLTYMMYDIMKKGIKNAYR